MVQQSPDQQAQLLQQEGFPSPGLVNGSPAPMPGWETQFIQDELDAASMGDVFPPSSFHFPANMSVSDFTAVENLAHQFAANSNWRFMPTGNMILNAIRMGVTDPQQAFSYWYGQMPSQYQSQVPWLRYGMNSQQYTQATNSIGDVLNRLTGSDSLDQIDAASRQQMISQGWSQSKMEQYLRQHLADSNPWLDQKYGYTYQSWQQNKKTHREDVIQRYGIDAANNDQAYLNMQDNPLQSQERAGGSQISYNSGSNQSTFYNKNSLMDYGSNPVR